MKIINTVFITIFLLAGCQSTFSPEYAARVKAYEGKHIDDVIKDWGVPASSVKLSDGTTMWEFFDSRQEYKRGITIYRNTANLGRTSQQVQERNVELWCKTTFTTYPEGIIYNIVIEGNYCR